MRKLVVAASTILASLAFAGVAQASVCMSPSDVLTMPQGVQASSANQGPGVLKVNWTDLEREYQPKAYRSHLLIWPAGQNPLSGYWGTIEGPHPAPTNTAPTEVLVVNLKAKTTYDVSVDNEGDVFGGTCNSNYTAPVVSVTQ